MNNIKTRGSKTKPYINYLVIEKSTLTTNKTEHFFKFSNKLAEELLSN